MRRFLLVCFAVFLLCLTSCQMLEQGVVSEEGAPSSEAQQEEDVKQEAQSFEDPGVGARLSDFGDLEVSWTQKVRPFEEETKDVLWIREAAFSAHIADCAVNAAARNRESEKTDSPGLFQGLSLDRICLWFHPSDQRESVFSSPDAVVKKHHEELEIPFEVAEKKSVESFGTVRIYTCPIAADRTANEADRLRCADMQTFVLYSPYMNYALSVSFDPYTTGFYLGKNASEDERIYKKFVRTLMDELVELDCEETVKAHEGATEEVELDVLLQPFEHNRNSFSGAELSERLLRLKLPRQTVEYVSRGVRDEELAAADDSIGLSEVSKAESACIEGLQMSLSARVPVSKDSEYYSEERPFEDAKNIFLSPAAPYPGHWFSRNVGTTVQGYSVYRVKREAVDSYSHRFARTEAYVIYDTERSFAVCVSFEPYFNGSYLQEEEATHLSLVEQMTLEWVNA